MTMRPGEVAKFDAQLRQWFDSAGDRPVGLPAILGREGERTHVRFAAGHKSETG